MGCDPSQFQGVASSDLVENVETVVHCSVFSDKGCEGMYGGETICPYDDVFVGVVGELSAGVGDGCEFSLVHGAEVGKIKRVFVYDCIVIVIVCSDSVSSAAAFFGFGSVCVAGYPVVRCFVNDVLELVSVNIGVVSWGCRVEVTL